MYHPKDGIFELQCYRYFQEIFFNTSRCLGCSASLLKASFMASIHSWVDCEAGSEKSSKDIENLEWSREFLPFVFVRSRTGWRFMVYFLFRHVLHGFYELLFTTKKAETPPPSNPQIYIYKRTSIYFMLVLTNLPRHYTVIFKALHMFHMHRHTHTCTCLLPEYCLHVLATFGVAPACKWPFEVDGINMAIHESSFIWTMDPLCPLPARSIIQHYSAPYWVLTASFYSNYQLKCYNYLNP